MAAVKDLSVQELERVIESVVRRTMGEYLEDLEGLASRRYLDSVEEARAQYRAGDTTSMRDLRGG